MRNYKYEGNIETLKTLPSEVTVEEFKHLNIIQENFIGSYMYYLEVFEELGLSTEFVDAMDDKTMLTIMRDFQEDFITDKKDFKKSIEIEGYRYTAYDKEFILSARDSASIEERMQKDNFGWISYALAVIFKRDDLTTKEHKAPAHQKHKEKLFKDITMDIALPYIMYIAEGYIENIKLMTEV